MFKNMPSHWIPRTNTPICSNLLLQYILTSLDFIYLSSVLWFVCGSPGLVVLEMYPNTRWTFFTLICSQNCIVYLKKTENNRKRGREWPIWYDFTVLCKLPTNMYTRQYISTECFHDLQLWSHLHLSRRLWKT